MTDKQIIQEWIGATKDAIADLKGWLAWLEEWEEHGGERREGDFNAAFQALYNRGLGDSWADGCEAGGGLDRLADAVQRLCHVCGHNRHEGAVCEVVCDEHGDLCLCDRHVWG